jgi:predicted phosphate transport protein (TIGR00153 family)
VRLRLSPRDNSFYDLFADLANHLVVGANLLQELLGADLPARAEIAEKLRAAEHEADESTHAIMQAVNQTFVTPFDREDIYRLASNLDDVMDAMEAAADIVVLYQVAELPSEIAEQVGVLIRAADLTAAAMPRLRTMRDLSEYWIEINRLENQADKTHRRFLARLFSGEYDAMTVMKLKDVAQYLEDGADAFESVANTVESIAVKES